jgi:hypothetical protein
MKILRLPTEIAGQLGITAQAKRALGCEAFSMSSPHPFGYLYSYSAMVLALFSAPGMVSLGRRLSHTENSGDILLARLIIRFSAIFLRGLASLGYFLLPLSLPYCCGHQKNLMILIWIDSKLRWHHSLKGRASVIHVGDYGAANIDSVLNILKRASHAQLPTWKGRVGINQMQAQ